MAEAHGPPDSGPAELPFAAYLLERRLAVGGMSEVFLARPRHGSTPAPRVVIKRLLPDLVEDDGVRRAFELEARLHAACAHANVVGFYETGTYAGEPFIAMEYVAGVDLFRLCRRAEADGRRIEPSVAVLVARELCAALEAVHGMRDAHGGSLGVIHRDVTPSNIYLSKRGEIKLGDFGIARTSTGAVPSSSFALKGKYQYLSPEQVSGEPYDHRSDLFSLAVVLTELVIGGPLFQGAGQLAVLLAIRDGRIDALRAARGRIPPALFGVLERALAKDPRDRFASARALDDALEASEARPRSALRAELASLVAYAADSVSAARRLEGAVLEARALSRQPEAPPSSRRAGPARRAALEASIQALEEDPSAWPAASTLPDLEGDGPPSRRLAAPFGSCRLRTRKGVVEVGLPKLIELLATGQVEAEAEVDLGDGFAPLRTQSLLARYLPTGAVTTSRVAGPGVPDFVCQLPAQGIDEALAWIQKNQETGALFAEPSPNDRRKELYFEEGRLILASSSEPSSLLGEQLVARGLIDRAELELAVLVMHRYGGRIGDTLIALGLVDPVDVFQAIRAQGRERVAAMFAWRTGVLSFYRGVVPRAVEFRLDLDVPTLLLAGDAEARTDEQVRAAWAARRDRTMCVAETPPWATQATWPGTIVALLDELAGGPTVAQVVDRLSTRCGEAEVLRALDAAILLAVVEPA